MGQVLCLAMVLAGTGIVIAGLARKHSA
jgi:hypothetical protein